MVKFLNDFSRYTNPIEFLINEKYTVNYFDGSLRNIIENDTYKLICEYDLRGNLTKFYDTDNEIIYTFFDFNGTKYIPKTIVYKFKNFKIHLYYIRSNDKIVLSSKEIIGSIDNMVYSKKIYYYDNGNIKMYEYRCNDCNVNKRHYPCHFNAPSVATYDYDGYVIERLYFVANKTDNSLVIKNENQFSFKQLKNSFYRTKNDRSFNILRLKALNSFINGTISKNEFNEINELLNSKKLIDILGEN